MSIAAQVELELKEGGLAFDALEPAAAHFVLAKNRLALKYFNQH